VKLQTFRINTIFGIKTVYVSRKCRVLFL